MANRHKSRILAFQALYGWDMTGNDVEELFSFQWLKEEVEEDTLLYSKLIISGVLQNREQVDKTIADHLLKWDFDRLARVDLAILRISTYTLLFLKDVPSRVAINEAIEIAKDYAAPESYKFINGVLDGIAKTVL
ncbi:MAG: transcription antitermination factor NusB [Spirochaetales bacterium]|nr:transcription antitermination factor NusB [Spirochaetales bacterium]